MVVIDLHDSRCCTAVWSFFPLSLAIGKNNAEIDMNRRTICVQKQKTHI